MRTIKEELFEEIKRDMVKEEKKGMEYIEGLEKEMFKKPYVVDKDKPIKFNIIK